MSNLVNHQAIRPYVRRPEPLLRTHGSSRLGRYCIAAILVGIGFQLLFLLVNCGWDLCGDEAEYWMWSRRLDWSYFSKGPLVAWLIRLSTAVAGDWAVRLTGTMMPAVRLPAVLLGGLTAWGVFRLAAWTCGGVRVGTFALLLLPVVPLFVAGGVLMTIDAPFICCWTWAAVWAAAGTFRDDSRAWTIAGAIAAAGVLAKYTMLIFPLSVGLFLLLSRVHRRQFARPGYWIMVLLCGLAMVPILIWNARHGWVGAGHVASRIGLTHASWGGIDPVLRFVTGEAAALGGIWFVVGLRAVVLAMRAISGRQKAVGSREGERQTGGRQRFSLLPAAYPGLLYLLCLSGMMWTGCLIASLMGVTQPNWAAPAYVSGVVLIAWRIDDELSSGSGRGRWKRMWFYAGCWGASAAFAVALHHTEWFYPIVARMLPRPTVQQPTPIRQFDPTCRLRGYRALAPEVDRLAAAVRAEGVEPFILTPTYGLAASLSFYLPGQTEVYCLGGPAGMTTDVGTQHDLWRPNPRLDPDVFRGRPAIVVEPANPMTTARAWTQAGLFGRSDETATTIVTQNGVAVAAWNVTVCRDFRGISAVRWRLKNGRVTRPSSGLDARTRGGKHGQEMP